MNLQRVSVCDAAYSLGPFSVPGGGAFQSQLFPTLILDMNICMVLLYFLACSSRNY